MNLKERAHLASCEIIVETITLHELSEDLSIYFLWKKGNKQTKSAVYQIEPSDQTVINEKMEINLKFYVTNAQIEAKNERELCCFTLGVQSWPQNYQRVELEIEEYNKKIGIINIQMRKRHVMELENFHKFSAEIEESFEEEDNLMILKSQREEKNTAFIELEKEIEDLKYLNEKLKKDRAFLIARNETVEKEISHIKSAIQKELSAITEHYEAKITSRTSIFQEEIQELITTFNQNSITNTFVMKSVISENESLAAELTELRIITEEEFSKQEISYKAKLADLEEEKERLIFHVEDLERKIEAYEKELSEALKKLDETKEQLDNTTLNYGIDKKDFKARSEEYEKQIETHKKQISDFKNIIAERDQEIELKKERQEQLLEEIEVRNSNLEKELHEKIKLESELEAAKDVIEELRIDNSAKIEAFKKLDEDYQLYITESEKKNIEYQKEIHEVELHSKERELEFDKIIAEEREKYFTENLRLTEANMKIEDYEKIMIVKDEEIKTFIDENTKMNDQMLEEHKRYFEFTEQNKELTQEIEHLKDLLSTAEMKETYLNQELESGFKKSQMDLEIIKEQFEESIKNREKYYEEESQVNKTKLELNENMYTKLINDFKIEIEMYKKEIEKLQQESIKQLNEINELNSANKRIEFENSQYQVLLNDAKDNLREREKKYEESLKLFLSSSQGVEEIKSVMGANGNQNKGNKKKKPLLQSSSIDFELQDSDEPMSLDHSAPLSKVTLKVPKFDREVEEIPEHHENNEINEAIQMEYLEHLKELQETIRLNEKQIQNLTRTNIKIEDEHEKFVHDNEINVRENQFLKEENKELENKIFELQNEIKELEIMLIKEQVEAQKLQFEKEDPKIDSIEASFKMAFDNDKKKIEDLSMKDSKERFSRRSLSKGSREDFMIETKDQAVQVEIIKASAGPEKEEIFKTLNSQPSSIPQRIFRTEEESGNESMNQNSEISIASSQPKVYIKTPILSEEQKKVQTHPNGKEEKERKSELVSFKELSGSTPNGWREDGYEKILELERMNSVLSSQTHSLQNENKEKMTEITKKQEKIEKLENRNKELFDELLSVRQDTALKLSNNESKLFEYSELTKREEEEISKIRNTLLQKDIEIRETQQNMVLQKNRYSSEIEQLQEEIKKLKGKVSELEERSSKNQQTNFSKLLQEDLEESNKKILELTRNINQLRMEKESTEDEIKLIKRRFGDLEKSYNDANQKKITAEEELESTSRKFNKIKRDHEEVVDELNRYKEQYKRMQEEVSNFSSISSQTLLERKKYLQEKLELEEEVSRKESETRKLQKELQKHTDRLYEKEELSKNNQLSKTRELESLQLESTKYRKQNIELEESIETLEKKLSSTISQNLQNTEALKQSYRENLNVYINEISEIKNILNASDEEIRGLQEDRRALQEELERVMNYVEHLEAKLDEFKTEKDELEKELIKSKDELKGANSEISHYEEDSITLHSQIALLQEHLAKENSLLTLKSAQLLEFSELSEKYLYELQNTKVALSNLESQHREADNLMEEREELEKELREVQELYVEKNREFEKYKSVYVYSQKELEDLATEFKEGYDELRKKELAETVDSLDVEYEAKSLKREKEILELYNENAKIKILIQNKEDESSQIFQKLTQLEPYQLKFKQLKSEHEDLNNEFQSISQELTKTKSKYAKIENTLKEYERNIQNMTYEIDSNKNGLENEKSKSMRLEQEVYELQTGYKMAKEELKKVTNDSNCKNESLKATIQNYEQKILSIELENMRIKEREENMHKEYKNQLHKTEVKIKELLEELHRSSSESEHKSKEKLKEKESIIEQLNKQSFQMTEKHKNLEREVSHLKQEINEISMELSNAREQMEEDEEIYIMEINKLKNTAKEMQDLYSENVNELEEELADVNRMLTMERLKNRGEEGLTDSGIRLRAIENDFDNRLEEKLKNKDRKIEELQNNIFIMEETIANLKKRNEFDEDEYEELEENPEGKEMKQNLSISGISNRKSKYYTLYNNLLAENTKTMTENKSLLTKIEENSKWFKKEQAGCKEKEEESKMIIEKQNMEIESLTYELTTVKSIYGQLQEEIDKRQIKTIENINIETMHEHEIETRETKIRSMEEEMNEIKEDKENLKQKLKNKESEVQTLIEKLKNFHSNNSSKVTKNETNKIHEMLKQENASIQKELTNLEKECSKLRQENQAFKIEINNFKSKEDQFQKQLEVYIQNNQNLVNKIYQNEEIVGKFTVINEKSEENYGVNVEELVLGGYLDEKNFDIEQEANQLKQDIEELQFNYDRRELDIEEMKKENLELSLKVEELEFISEQVDGLRKICDKLEEEKKIAVFREEAIRVRLSNLVTRSEQSENIREGLSAILNFNSDIYV